MKQTSNSSDVFTNLEFLLWFLFQLANWDNQWNKLVKRSDEFVIYLHQGLLHNHLGCHRLFNTANLFKSRITVSTLSSTENGNLKINKWVCYNMLSRIPNSELSRVFLKSTFASLIFFFVKTITVAAHLRAAALS